MFLAKGVASPTVNEIQDSNHQSKPTTPINISDKLSPVKTATRSLSSSFAESAEINAMAMNIRTRSPRDTPQRKYFDSGDYELAKVGKVDAACVGSEHASPEKLHSRSFSAQHLHPVNHLSGSQFSRSVSLSQNSPIKVSFSAASLEDLSLKTSDSLLKFPAC